MKHAPLPLSLVLALGACASRAKPPVAPTVAPAAVATTAPTIAPTVVPTVAPKIAISRSLDECRALIVAPHHTDDEMRCLAQVDAPTLREQTQVAYLEVTALLYARRYEPAAHVFDELLTRARATPPSAKAEGWVQNGLTWLYWGAGDFDAALDANRRVEVAASSLEGDDKRELLLHYWWDRAALLVERAMVDPSLQKGAKEARAAYRRLAHLPDEHDGLAVLDAYFAYCAHKGAAARRAAETVDVTKDDDVQDLYIIALAKAAGGDAASARAICERVAHANEYPMKPLVLERMSDCNGPMR